MKVVLDGTWKMSRRINKIEESRETVIDYDYIIVINSSITPKKITNYIEQTKILPVPRETTIILAMRINEASTSK